MQKLIKDKMRSVRISSEHLGMIEKRGYKLQGYLDEKLKQDFEKKPKKKKEQASE
jgi:hypothetical protein